MTAVSRRSVACLPKNCIKMAGNNVKSDSEFTEIDGHKVRKYNFNLQRIPRLHYNDPQVDKLIKNEVQYESTSTEQEMIVLLWHRPPRYLMPNFVLRRLLTWKCKAQSIVLSQLCQSIHILVPHCNVIFQGDPLIRKSSLARRHYETLPCAFHLWLPRN